MLTTIRERFKTPALRLNAGLALVGVAVGLLLARLDVIASALLVGGALLVAATMWEPLIGLGAALVLGPFRAWLQRAVPQVPSEVGQALLFLALGAWIARALLERRRSLALPPLLVPLALFLFAALLSLWAPADIWGGFLEFAKWGQIVLICIVVYDRLVVTGDAGGAGRVALAVGGVLLAGLTQALVGLYQHVSDTSPENFAINDRFYRAFGTFEQPNPYAGFVGIVAALVGGVAVTMVVDRWFGSTDGAQRDSADWAPGWALGLLLPAAALLVAGLYASWSRGGWMGFGAAVLVMGALLPRRGFWGVLVAALLVALGLGLYATGRLPAAITGRLTGFLAYTRFEDVRGVGITDANFAVMERMAHWQAAISMWRANFWAGVGLGCYAAAYPDHNLINWTLPLGHAHNIYLNLLAETGLLGLVTYLAWQGVLLVRLTLASRRLAGWRRGLALGLLGAWTHIAVHGLVDSLLVNNVHLHVGVVLALSAWVGSKSQESRVKSQESKVKSLTRLLTLVF